MEISSLFKWVRKETNDIKDKERLEGLKCFENKVYLSYYIVFQKLD